MLNVVSNRIQHSTFSILFRSFAADELRRLDDARAEYAERTRQRSRAREFNLGLGGANVRVSVSIGPHRLPVAKQPPPRTVEHFAHHPFCVVRIPEAVVIYHARDVGPWGEHRL